jgi:hypothetical protein
VESKSQIYEYAHKHICKNRFGMFFNKATAQKGTNVRARVFNAGLLARSQEGLATCQQDQGFPWFFLVP